MTVTQQIRLTDLVSAKLTKIGAEYKAMSVTAKTSAVQANAAMRKVGSELRVVRRIAKTVALVAAGVFTGAIVQAAKFEKGMAEISTLMRGVTKGAMAEMSNELRELAKQSGETLDSLVGAKYDIVSAGFQDAADSAKVLDASVRLGIAGVSDAATAADVLTTALNSYGLEADQAGIISDKLFKIVEIGKTKLNLIAGSLGRAAAIAATAGVTFDELGAAIGALTASGQNTEEAITAIRAAIVEFQKPGKEMRDAFKAIGIESGEMLIKQEGLTGALKAVKEAAEKQGVTMSSLLKNVRTMTAVIPLVTTASGDFADNLIKMAEAAGSVDEAYKKMLDTFARQFKILKANVIDVFVDLGNRIMPEFRQALDELRSWIETNREKIVQFFVDMFDKIVDGIKWIVKNKDWLKLAFKIAVIAAITVKMIALSSAIGGLALAITGITLGPGGTVLVGLGLLATAIGAIALAARDATPDIDAFTESLNKMSRGAIIKQINALNAELKPLQKKATGLGALFTPEETTDRIKEITQGLKILREQLLDMPRLSLSVKQTGFEEIRGKTIVTPSQADFRGDAIADMIAEDLASLGNFEQTTEELAQLARDRAGTIAQIRADAIDAMIQDELDFQGTFINLQDDVNLELEKSQKEHFAKMGKANRESLIAFQKEIEAADQRRIAAAIQTRQMLTQIAVDMGAAIGRGLAQGEGGVREAMKGILNVIISAVQSMILAAQAAALAKGVFLFGTTLIADFIGTTAAIASLEAARAAVNNLAGGGIVGDTGTSSFQIGTDRVPALLTPGEFIIPAGRVRELGIQNIESFTGTTRSGGSQAVGFQQGGLVSSPASVSSSTFNINMTIHINALDGASVNDVLENNLDALAENMKRAIEDRLLDSF